ncbi:MAG: hypothetical protein DRP84_10735, partial [Spirochaetes bacterium]
CSDMNTKHLEKGTSIEQWFGLVKGRARGFYNNINAKSIDNEMKRMEERLKVLLCCVIVLLA